MSETVEVDDTTRQLVTQLRHINNEITDLQAIAEDIKAKLRSTGVAPGQQATSHGETLFTVTANRRFDTKVAEHTVPASLLDLCRTSRIDPAAAREVLPPALFAACMRDVGQPVIRLA